MNKDFIIEKLKLSKSYITCIDPEMNEEMILISLDHSEIINKCYSLAALYIIEKLNNKSSIKKFFELSDLFLFSLWRLKEVEIIDSVNN